MARLAASPQLTRVSVDRIVFPGASLLGWSYSKDKGQTWTYGGKVKPPSGIAALYSVGEPDLDAEAAILFGDASE